MGQPAQQHPWRRWIDHYHQVKKRLEKISEINRELLRRERKQ